MRTHLQRKAFDEETIEQVLAYLNGLELLDDVAFAQYWVEQRETFRPRSRYALGQELRQKGISREIVAAALEEVDETAAARRAAEKQANRRQDCRRMYLKRKWPAICNDADFHTMLSEK